MANKSEFEGLPPEELIDFDPSPVVATMLMGLEEGLTTDYTSWVAKKGSEMSKSALLLSEFLKEGEVIVSVGTLAIGEEFILVTGYPRTEKNEKKYTVDAFRMKKEKKRKVKFLVTTTGVWLPLDAYVIRQLSK